MEIQGTQSNPVSPSTVKNHLMLSTDLFTSRQTSLPEWTICVCSTCAQAAIMKSWRTRMFITWVWLGYNAISHLTSRTSKQKARVLLVVSLPSYSFSVAQEYLPISKIKHCFPSTLQVLLLRLALSQPRQPAAVAHFSSAARQRVLGFSVPF